MDATTIHTVQDAVNEIDDSLHEFYQPNKELHSKLLDIISQLYSFQKQVLPTKNGIPKLLTSGFDVEQIWEQLQTYSGPLVDDLSQKLDTIHENQHRLSLLKQHILEQQEEDEEEDGQVDERALRRMMSNEDDDEDSDDEDEEGDAEMMEMEDGEDDNNNTSRRQTTDEDDFLPEEDINKFISQMEGDLDVLDDTEFDEGDTDEAKRAWKEMYGNSALDDDDEDNDDDDEEEAISRPKTLFQQHQEKLLETIEQMEDENMKDKEWQKKGEATAKDRPLNSLLEEDLVFEHQSKSKPIITEEVTRDLESIIISRIVAGIYDDPERPDIDDKKENAQNLVNLQSEKSKKSLAEIYEDMYLKKVEGKDIDLDLSQTDPKIAQERNRIKRMMASALYALNKMSSFNYVAPPIAEFETVEDGSKVKPIDVKTTKQQEEEKLAPQDIVKPIRNLPTANAERTAEERKRKRREVKESQSKKAKKARELVDLINPAAGDKKKGEKLLKQLNEKKTKIPKEVDPNASNYSSSKRFFELMQEKASQYTGGQDKKKKKDDKKVSKNEAIKMKL